MRLIDLNRALATHAEIQVFQFDKFGCRIAGGNGYTYQETERSASISM